MKQQSLFPKQRSQKKSLLSVANSYDENNLRTAREVLADPEHWGGEGSCMVSWARTVVARLGSNEPLGGRRA